jgi:hypothetical protein
MTFTIQVLRDGHPVTNQRVGVIPTFSFKRKLDGYTDDDGLATFNYEVDPGEIGIYVHDEKQATYTYVPHFDDGEVFSINLGHSANETLQIRQQKGKW